MALSFIYLNYKIDKSNTHIKQFVKHPLIPDVLIMKSRQPLNQWNVSSGQPWLIAAQRDFKQVLHLMILVCSSIWIQDINRMPWSLPPWKQIIHSLIRPPNSIDRIQTVPECNSVYPWSSYLVTTVSRKSLDMVLPSKWIISEKNIKYEITDTFLVENAFVCINSVMLEIDRVGIPHWGILCINIFFGYRLFFNVTPKRRW